MNPTVIAGLGIGAFVLIIASIILLRRFRSSGRTH
jgi:hypothetical protein